PQYQISRLESARIAQPSLNDVVSVAGALGLDLGELLTQCRQDSAAEKERRGLLDSVIIAVTSHRAGAGTSTTAANLAYAITQMKPDTSQDDRRVLLVDGDIANGYLDAMLAVHPSYARSASGPHLVDFINHLDE